MKTLRLFTVLLLSALPSTVAAQSRTAVAIGVGPSEPIGKLRDTQRSGIDADIGFIRGSDESPIGLRLDLAYDHLPGKPVGGLKNPARKTVAGTADVVFSFSGYTFKPYVIGGAGEFRTTSTTTTDQKIRFGFDFGLGFTLPIGGKALFVESRVNSISQHQAKPLRYVPVLLGFLF